MRRGLILATLLAPIPILLLLLFFIFLIFLIPLPSAQAQELVKLSLSVDDPGAEGAPIYVSYTLNGTQYERVLLNSPFILQVDHNSDVLLEVPLVWGVEPRFKRYSLLSWQVDGLSPRAVTRAGEGRVNLTLTMDNDHAVTLNAVLQYPLLISGGSLVAVSPASPTGDEWYDAGMSVRVSSEYTWDLRPEGSRKNLVGYRLDGVSSSVARSSTGRFTTPPILMDRPHRIVFEHTTQYLLSIMGGSEVRPLGSPTGDFWYDEGSDVARVETAYSWNIVGDRSRENLVAYSIDDGPLQPVPRRGEGTFITSKIVMSGSRLVTFRSVTQYRLKLLDAENAIVEGSQTQDGWFDSGSLVEVRLVSPSVQEGIRRIFQEWRVLDGPSAGLDRFANPLKFRILAPMLLQARWRNDRVLLDAASRLRVDVGSEVVVRLHYRWESDGSNATFTQVRVNGTTLITDSQGWATLRYRQSWLGRAIWRTTEANGGPYAIDLVIPEVIFDRVEFYSSGAEKSRVGIGSDALVWFKGRYAYDGEPFDASSGAVYVDGELASWNPLEDRWEAVVRNEGIGRTVHLVTRIIDTNYGLTSFTNPDQPPSIIWDAITVLKAFADDDRVNVGDTVKLAFEVGSAFDSTPIRDGSIWINGIQARLDDDSGLWEISVRRGEVVGEVFKVSKASGNSLSITALDPQQRGKLVVWDRITAKAVGAEEERLDPGESTTIFFQLVYEYDGTLVEEGRVFINGREAEFNSALGRWEMEVRREGAGATIFKVTRVEGNRFGITLLDPNMKRLKLLWDRLQVYLSGVSDPRVGIGDEVTFWFKVRYQIGGEEVKGGHAIVILNSTIPAEWSEERERWEYRVKFESVGKRSFYISDLQDLRYGLSDDLMVESADRPFAIWDKVQVRLFFEDEAERFSLGEPIDIAWEAHYAYDGRPFQGRILLSGSRTPPSPGLYTYSVLAVEDSLYGVGAFEANVLQAIVDEVLIRLEVGDERVEVGRNASIAWEAHYAYDGRPFQGRIRLNASTIQDRMGSYYYSVEDIEDRLYNLTSFSSNSVKVTFDALQMERRLEVWRPGILEVRVRPFYLTDGSKAEGAIVRINDEEARRLPNGWFGAKLESFSPLMDLKVEVRSRGFTPLIVKETVLHLGNVAVSLIAQLLLASAIVLLYRGRRARKARKGG